MFLNGLKRYSKMIGLRRFFCETKKEEFKRTSLHSYHKEVLGARMVGFAGYDMPVQYSGVIEEHTACRENAALFDVSHMGQVK